MMWFSRVWRTALLAALLLAATGTVTTAQTTPPDQEAPFPGEPMASPHGEAEAPLLSKEPAGELLASLDFQDVDRLVKPLGLTEEQRTKLREALIARGRQMIRLRSDLELQKFELDLLLAEPKPDPQKVRTQAAKVEEVRRAVALERIETILAVKEILTPEQQEKLRTLRSGRRGLPQLRKRLQKRLRGALR